MEGGVAGDVFFVVEAGDGRDVVEVGAEAGRGSELDGHALFKDLPGLDVLALGLEDSAGFFDLFETKMEYEGSEGTSHFSGIEFLHLNVFELSVP